MQTPETSSNMDDLQNSQYRDEKQIRVIIATPLGRNGRGGIDRLNDSILTTLESHPELRVVAKRLVTRGQRGLFAAQFVFSHALVSLLIAALRHNVDVVHIHLSNWGSSYSKTVLGATARLLGLPYTIHLHGSGFDDFLSSAPRHLANAVDRFFAESTQIVVLGQYWAKAITDRVPQVADRINVLANATERSHQFQVPAADNRVRITCLGQLGERKGTPQLIEALHKLSEREDWSATIAGDGKVEESRILVSQLGLGERVHLPGWLDSAKTNELLCNTDILVLPSFAENLPMVILEAFAHGIPVVSTPVGAIPEVIESGRNGLLVPVGDVSGLAAAIQLLIENQTLRLRFGQAAQKDQTEKYDIEPYVAHLTKIWRATISQSKRNKAPRSS